MTKEREGQSERSAFFRQSREKSKEIPTRRIRKNAGQKVDHSDI